MALTVDEAIASLLKIKNESPLGGNTCVAVCFVGSGIEDHNVDELSLIKDRDGAVVYAMVNDHCFIPKRAAQ